MTLTVAAAAAAVETCGMAPVALFYNRSSPTPWVARPFVAVVELTARSCYFGTRVYSPGTLKVNSETVIIIHNNYYLLALATEL